MITKIKQLADEAVKLQNKDRMDSALREISAMCVKVDVPVDPLPPIPKNNGGKK